MIIWLLENFVRFKKIKIGNRLKIGKLGFRVRGFGRPFIRSCIWQNGGHQCSRYSKWWSLTIISTYFGVTKFSKKFLDSRRAQSYPKKRHFAVYVIFRNWLLIYEVRKILSKFDSRNAQFGVRKATRGRPEVIQVRPGGSRRSVLIRKSFSRADTAVGKVVKSYEKWA